MSGIARVDSKILHAQTADRRHHPTILVAVIVDATNLADIPANGHDFEEVALVNQISRVVAFCVKKIRRKRIGLNRFLRGEIKDSRNRKLSFGNAAKLLYPVVNRQHFHRRASQHEDHRAMKTALLGNYSNALSERQQK